jgi:hypothetical protein
VDITGLSGWAYEIAPVDRAFIEANLVGDAIPSTRIESLAVPKLTGGVINATETITSEGVIRAVDDVANPVVQVGIGPATFGEPVTYLMWAYNGTDRTFSVDELGNVSVTGSITIAAGSTGVANLSDAGTLATKSSADWDTEVAGTGKPANNADVTGDNTAASIAGQGSLATLNSVDWNSTLDNIPARVSDTATTGLNLTDTYIGYYDGSAFKSYIQSNGNFHFGGDANNFIDFNGTQLVIDTDNFSVDGVGNATFSGDLLAAGGSFSGNVQLTGDNLWADTRVQVGGVLTDADYVVIDVDNLGNGVVETYKKFAGDYKLFKSLTRTEAGTANTGDIVTLPGYWSSAPKIQVSPNTVPTYLPQFSNQSQTLSCQARSLSEVSAGVWQFEAISNLQLGSASGSVAVNIAGSGGVAETPENTNYVDVKVSMSSSRGTGTAPNYYYRRVLWRIGYATSSGGTYTWSTYQTKNIGATFSSVSDSRSISLTSGLWFIKVEFYAEDAGGTFSVGGATYEYTSAVVSNAGPVSGDAYDETEYLPLLLPTYTPPSGYNVYEVDYTVDVAHDVDGLSGTYARNRYSDGPSYYYTSGGSISSFTTITNNNEASYNVSALEGEMNAEGFFGEGLVRLALKNGSATIRSRKLLTNSTTASNSYNYLSFDYTLSSAQIIASGVLNWLAVGE